MVLKTNQDSLIVFLTRVVTENFMLFQGSLFFLYLFLNFLDLSHKNVKFYPWNVWLFFCISTLEIKKINLSFVCEPSSHLQQGMSWLHTVSEGFLMFILGDSVASCGVPLKHRVRVKSQPQYYHKCRAARQRVGGSICRCRGAGHSCHHSAPTLVSFSNMMPTEHPTPLWGNNHTMLKLCLQVSVCSEMLIRLHSTWLDLTVMRGISSTQPDQNSHWVLF